MTLVLWWRTSRPRRSGWPRRHSCALPGAFQAWAHDYRPDLPVFVRGVFDLDATDEQVAAVRQAVQERELVREAFFD